MHHQKMVVLFMHMSSKNKIVYAARCDPRDKIWRACFIKHGEDFRTLKDEDIFCWQYCDWPEPPSSI